VPEPAGLFDHRARRDAPLAERVRPRTLADVVGHDKLVGPDAPLGRAIAADRVPSMILWGPPGAGKTTLAQVIAASTRATFVPFSAVLHGVAEVRAIVEEARVRRATGAGRTILFVDEIHRFNRAQQDAFLPHVEDGTVTLIGATTENPSFALNAPLLSRATVYRLEPIDAAALARMLRRAVAHPDGLALRIEVEDEVLRAVAELARGDGRRSLNLLEVSVEHAELAGKPTLEIADVVAVAGHRTLVHDREGDEHFNVASAFIKSMRGSDPDAAVYWMMRMIEAGDDPLFVLRRMLIFASEDVGLADPRALELAVAADAAFRRLGLPEGLYAMAEAAIYLACAPKSNAANLAWHRAKERIAATGSLPVPLHLRNAPTRLMKDLGHGQGYRHAHDEEDGYARGATYLPDALAGERYYEPTSRGLEGKIGAWLTKLRGEPGSSDPA